MNEKLTSPAAVELATHIRAAREELARRWVDRIAARVMIPPEAIFPTSDQLDHVPQLISAIADYIENPHDEITTDGDVIAQAEEVGELRFSQGFDASEILKEYELLGGELYAYSLQLIARMQLRGEAEDVLLCAHRIFRAISVIAQVTTARYLRALGERVGEREERLRRFNRMITHELKNRVGATLGAGQLLQEEWLGDGERRRFAGMVTENAQAIQKVLENLIALSRLDGERRRQRNVALPEVVTEVFRQLRELARARQVELRVRGDLPEIEVNGAAVELCLSNYLSNAIKYSDGTAAARWAEIEAVVEEAADQPGTVQLIVRVRDNGVGVPADLRERLFERFFRAHADSARVEGTGLGLNLVLETATALGGTAWAEFEDRTGSVFAFSLPCRRVGQPEPGSTREPVSEASVGRSPVGRFPPDAAPVTVSD